MLSELILEPEFELVMSLLLLGSPSLNRVVFDNKRWGYFNLTLYYNHIIHAIGKRGLWNNVKLLVPEFAFDVLYRINTFSQITTDKLEGLLDDDRKSAHQYQAVNGLLFKKTFSFLKSDSMGKIFVDFGCGKGRALFMAAELGYQHVIGIEFSKPLCDAASKNLELFKKRTGNEARIEIVHQGASRFSIPPESDLFYFFNPFDATVMGQVISNIKESLRKKSRLIRVVYINPVHKEIFMANGFKEIFSLRLNPSHEDSVILEILK